MTSVMVIGKVCCSWFWWRWKIMNFANFFWWTYHYYWNWLNQSDWSIFSWFYSYNYGRSLLHGTIFVKTTDSESIVTGEHLLKMVDVTIIYSTGHFNWEVEVTWLEKNSFEIVSIKPQVNRCTLVSEKHIILLVEVKLVKSACDSRYSSFVKSTYIVDQTSANTNWIVYQYWWIQQLFICFAQKIVRRSSK